MKRGKSYFSKKQLMIFLCLFPFIMFGCSKHKVHWEKAPKINKIAADKSIASFRDARTVKITVIQSYGEAKTVSLPLEEWAIRFLQYAGLKVVGPDVKACDATLRIEANGKALGAHYREAYYGKLGGYHYSGVDVTVQISFGVVDGAVYRKSFSVMHEPPHTISNFYRKPSDAPFGLVLEAFCENFGEMIGEIYGPGGLVAVLKDARNNWFVLQAMAALLKKLKDPRAVEPLITALEDKDIVTRSVLAEVLESITGENLGKDQVGWQKWWEENKARYLR